MLDKLKSIGLAFFLLVVAYFGWHVAAKSSADSRMEWAVRSFLQSGVKGTGPVLFPPAENARMFMAEHPDCCRFLPRDAGPVDSMRPWLTDPFGSVVHVTDGDRALYLYVPGAVES